MATTGGTANRGTQAGLAPGGARAKRKKNKAMSEHEVVGFLGRMIVQSMNDEDGDLSQVRQENLNYYVGKDIGDERGEGYSKFVTRESLETIEWLMPSVLRVFLSGDDVAVFDPMGPEDEEAAKQETDITNYFVMRANGSKGFVALHHWMKDTLMFPNGYVKAYMRDFERVDVGTYTGLNEFGVGRIDADPDIEILEQRTATKVVEGQPFELTDLRVRTRKMVRQLAISPVPGEEVLVDPNCTDVDLDEASFVCHRHQKSYSELVREGIDPKELDEVGSSENYQWNDERVNRLFYEDEDPDSTYETDDSMRVFWVHECYAWFDYDGTGVAQFRRVQLIGDRVFANEETNYQPLIAMSSILMPHKHNGMSMIDIVKDLNLLMTTLTRQLLDNTYRINVGRTIISEDAMTEDGSTMEALLNVQSEVLPVRGLPQNAVANEPVQSLIGDILPVLQHVDVARQERTGVAPEMTVDGNQLQEVRQDVFANALDRASQRVEMLVRIFAETGYKQLMLKVHQLLRSHWDIERTVKLRGKWVDVTPQEWQDRTDMAVSVGLGHSTKQMLLGMLVQLLSLQKEAMGQGMANPDKIFNTLEKMVNAANVGDVRQYFIEPSPENPEYQPPQPQPSPQDMLAQAQAQALQSESQRKDAETQHKIQTEGPAKQLDAQLKAAELELKRGEQQIKLRELDIKERELYTRAQIEDLAAGAEIENKQADTQAKLATADKTMAEAAATAVEAGETFKQAAEIVSQAGELNEGGSLPNVEFEGAEDGESENGPPEADAEGTDDADDRPG